MSNYTKTTDFAAKDGLESGNAGKIVRGTEFETEFDNIATAIATKADLASPSFSGTINITSASLNDGSVTISGFLDEDNMATNSPSHVPTQQSVKAYVDAQTAGIVTDTDTQTLTNKTLTSPVIDTGVSGTAVLDEDDMISDSNTKLATQQSIKAYVDTQTASTVLTGITDTATSSQVAISNASTVVSNTLAPQNTIFFDQTAVAAGTGKIHWQEYASGVLNTRYSIEYGNTHLFFKYDGTEIARFKAGADFTLENDFTVGGDAVVNGTFTSRGIDDNATSTQLSMTNTLTSISNTLVPAGIKFSGASSIHWEETIGDISYNRYKIEYGATRLFFKYDNTAIAQFLSDGTFQPNHDVVSQLDSGSSIGFYASSTDFGLKISDGGVGGKTIRLINNGTAVFQHNQVQNFVDLSNATYTKVAKLNISNIPTSSSGLSSGDVWNDSGTLKIVT